MQRITGLPDEQVAAFEDQIEAAVRAALAAVMEAIARRVEANMPVLASALVGADPGDGLAPPPDELPPGQPYVSPDDLTSIPPLWQSAVADQILPIAAQVFFQSVGKVHAGMVDASGIATLPSVGSLAAEQYLAQAKNTFDEVGDHLWAVARQQLSEGFEAGESIPQLAERLRSSAGITARTGVLVARTQVIEASNAGSFAVAQASGLTMKKFWIATNDLRTRPEHLDAESNYGPGGTPGPIDLNQPFIVGGYSAMFPAASSLPPSMRYNCRCTPGYVMPDRAPAQVRAQDLQTQQLADLPGTTGEVFPREAGPSGPGFDEPARGPDVAPGFVRPSLKAARTPKELRETWQAEVQAITGHPFLVARMPTDISMVTAREYAEGVLQMFAQFPEAKVDRILWFDDAASVSYAQVRRGGHAIEFNMKYASDTGRPRFLAARKKDAAGWDAGRGTSWGVRNDTTGQGVAYHEFTHILDIENARERIHGQIVPLLIQHAQREGITDIDDLIKRRISSYATENYQEMVAEAGTDVMVNGAAASQLSRDIFDLLREEYRARGFGLRTGPVGEVFPKAAAPKPRRVAVARGKDLTDDKDLAARAQREAEREHADTGLTPAGFPIKPEAYQGDYAFHEIAKAQDFDDVPRIVADDGQWQRLLDADYIPLYRGHGWAGGDGVGQVDAFNYGERYVGGGFAPGNNMSTRYQTALHYADGHDSAVGHYALPPDAKVISYPDLVAERDAYVAKLAPGDVERALYLDDDANLGLGRFGAAKGYDAMVVPRGETLLTDRVEEWVIFNRSKIVAYDDSAKGVAAASKITPAKMTAGERARRAKDVAVTAGRSIGHLTRELDQMIAEGGDEAFRTGALWRRIKAKGSELGTPIEVRDELMRLARSDNKGASLSALRAAIDKANLDAGVTRISAPGDVIPFDARRDKPWGEVSDIADGTPVTVLRSGSRIDYQGKPLQISQPRVRPATPQEIAAAQRAAPTTPAVTTTVRPSLPPTASVAQLRAELKARGLTPASGARKADLQRMLDEASPAPVVSNVLEDAARARQAIIDVRRASADALSEVAGLLDSGASARALTSRAEGIAGRVSGQAAKDLAPLVRAMKTGDEVKIRRAVTALQRKADLTPVGAPPPGQTWVAFDPSVHDVLPGLARPAPGAYVRVIKPAYRTQVNGETVQLGKATVEPLDAAEVKAIQHAPAEAARRIAVPERVAAAQADLQRIVATPQIGEPHSIGGASAINKMERHQGGTVITKDYTRDTKAAGVRDADAEELGALVMDALDVPTQAVLRTGDRSIVVSVLEGDHPEAIGPLATAAQRQTLAQTDGGRLLGLADTLVGNADRRRNWVRLADGRPASYDLGGAFRAPKLAAPADPEAVFARFISADGKAWSKSIDIAPADLAVIRARLEALRPEFERLGRATWHRQVMARLVEVEKRADPNAAIRLAEAVPDRAAVRAAVKAKAATIATQRGNAALIARVEELVQAKASKAVIRQELDPALREAEQLYAGADKAVADALRTAVDSGDAAKIRAALTRQSKASGLTPIGKAGAKAKFDPATMEGVGGTAIPDGADVIVVRRGAKLAGIETPEKAVVRVAKAPSTEKTVAKGDFTGLTRTSEAMGGNPGGIFEAGDGSRWYVKAAAGDAQARSEALALDLYRAAGLDAPEMVIGEGVEGLGQRQIATRFLDDAQVDLRARLANDPAYIAQVQGGFSVDAWLGNWDVVGANPVAGWDNIVSVAGQPVRIEAGGALRYRGLGGTKPFDDTVAEFDTLRDPAAARRAAQVFGDMTPEQLIASAERVRKVTPAKIKALVKKHGLDPDLADTLIARREDILRRAEALAGPKPMTVREYNAAIKAAVKGQDALDAAPMSAVGDSFEALNFGQKNAIVRYRENPEVNDMLRDTLDRLHQDVSDYRLGRIEEDVKTIDRIFDDSRLRADVELWRAPGSGRGIFGDSATWGDDLTGFEWSDSAYSSTSASKRVADRFTKDGGVRLRVLAPKGSKAIQLSELDPFEGGVGIMYANEAEVLLARGARYRVVRDRGWTEITHPTTHRRIKVRDLDVEVIVPDETPPLPWATK